MYLLYSFCLSAFFLLLLPYFVIQAIRSGKYSGSLSQRLGSLPSTLQGGSGRKTIWIHAVSVGELIAATQLIESLSRERPDYRVVISTTTRTGQQLARKKLAGITQGIFYFPFDWMFSVRRALERIDPCCVVLIETELWPNFLRECRRRKVIVLLANGRISDRSFRRYQLLKSFAAAVLRDLSLLIMQSPGDVNRVLKLGAPPDRVRVCGNLKYDVLPDDICTSTLERALVDVKHERLIVAGSTGPGEEEFLLTALGIVRGVPELSSTRLLIAPRHPERFDEVADLVERSNLKLARRSACAHGCAIPADADVILLDSVGELASAYRYASIAFVGGSLVPRGGHNVIEPAAFGKPIIVGPHTANFRQVIADFVSAEALVQLRVNRREEGQALGDALVGLLSDDRRARSMGERGVALLKASRGATDCTLNAILKVLDVASQE